MPKLICSHQKSNCRLSPIKMKRNCNLELRLVPAGIDEFKQDSNDHRNELDEDQEQEMRRQQITIFYGGKVCVCDVTELQARAILSLARREMEDKLATTPERSSSSRPVSPISLPSPQVYCADNGLSMKKSLQRFLQKRKTRIQATSPYNIGQSRRNGVVKSFM